MTAYRSRRTSEQMDVIREAIVAIAQADAPVTVRQVFYRLVSEGVIDKTENEYKSTVIRLIGELRLSGDLPWSWIADNTRWARRPRTFGGVEDALTQTAQLYRRRLWDDVEPLAAILEPFADEFDAKTISRKATPAQLSAWQQSRDHADAYRTLLQGWFAVWARVTSKPATDRPRKEHAPVRPGGVHVWRNPTLIADLSVRDGGAKTDVLHIAPHRENFRLIGPGEILQYETAYRLHHPLRNYAGVKVYELTSPPAPRPKHAANH